ncbi:P-loop containing nucleoside triphosphate hydrolase protein [Kalaharituber pfeilii]|nr:P-loop containing nucleoside triphosphate hydrolase protein [Kalaharituber pfeilii]
MREMSSTNLLWRILINRPSLLQTATRTLCRTQTTLAVKAPSRTKTRAKKVTVEGTGDALATKQRARKARTKEPASEQLATKDVRPARSKSKTREAAEAIEDAIKGSRRRKTTKEQIEADSEPAAKAPKRTRAKTKDEQHVAPKKTETKGTGKRGRPKVKSAIEVDKTQDKTQDTKVVRQAARTKTKEAKGVEALVKGSRARKKSVEAAKVPEPASTPTAVIKLRNYQQECIDAVIDHVKQNHRRLAISLATGSGKTVIFTQLIRQLPDLTEEATQSLILVHRRELLEQAYNHCVRAYPDKVIEVEMANKHATGHADITIASVPSLVSKDRITKFNPKKFKLILIDECHHAVAKSYMDTLDYFGALHPEKNGGNHPVIVGVSATLSRHDGLKMGTILDYIVYHKDYIDMIKENWLVNVMFTMVQTHVDLSSVRVTKGDFNLADLSYAVNTPQTNEITVRSWLEKAGDRKSTLVFCVDLAHVNEMTNTFRKHGIDARFVTSLTNKETRGQRLDQFRRREFPVLVNCGILTEGTDIPNIDCVVLARPTRSKNLLIQMIGRGMRLSPGKKDCHVIDMVGAVTTGIITVPTLFGLDPSTIVQEATPEKMQQLLEEQKEKEAKAALQLLTPSNIDPPLPGENLRHLEISRVEFIHYESIFDLIGDTANERWIRQVSKNAWVKVGNNEYILPAMKDFLKIEQDENGKYRVILKKPPAYHIYANQFMTEPVKALANDIETLEHAVMGADTYAAKHYPRIFIIHTAPWRKEPASENQLNALNRMMPDGDWEQKGLTKGRAADITTRIRYGSRNYKRAFTAIEKFKAAEAKQLELSQQQEVKVGKLTV